MPRANPGEVWIVDLGLAAKVRPCLLLSDYPGDDELGNTGNTGKYVTVAIFFVPVFSGAVMLASPLFSPGHMGAERRDTRLHFHVAERTDSGSGTGRRP